MAVDPERRIVAAAQTAGITRILTADYNWFIRRYRGYIAAILRRMHLPPTAIDAAIDEFWGYLFRTRALERADRGGRFRSFLSGVVRNYALTWQREQTQLPTHEDLTARLAAPPSIAPSEDLSLWAQQILHLALERLGREHAADERALRLFFGIAECVGGEPRARQRATEIAAVIGCSANALHQLLFRARARLRTCIEEEVAATIGSAGDLRDELVQLTTCKRRPRSA